MVLERLEWTKWRVADEDLSATLNTRQPVAPLLGELVRRIENATGASFGSNPKFPRIQLITLGEEERLEKLLAILDWIVEQTLSNGSVQDDPRSPRPGIS